MAHNDITNEMLIVEVPQGLTESRFTLTFKEDEKCSCFRDAFRLKTE
jgi:hypothetical protein